jgi:hypothetical protein
VFYTVFVPGSVARRRIDLNDLHVAGDGTHLRTGANSHGHKLCTCDNRDKPRSEHGDCWRRFHDPLASWGWDSYRECYVYGHGLYELTAYSLQHNCQLPLVINVLDNHRHDSVAYLAAVHEAVDRLGFHVATASLDKAHDALALYRLGVEHWRLDSVIPLNERHTGHFQFAPPLRLTEDGLPFCPAEYSMRDQDCCAKRMRLKWRCPLAAKGLPLTTCPHFAHDCSDSPYGRTVYTYPRQNYRLFSRLRHGSPLWKLPAVRRSCAERSIKRNKLDFGLDHTRLAGRQRWFFRVMLAAMGQHLDAWATHAPTNDSTSVFLPRFTAAPRLTALSHAAGQLLRSTRRSLAHFRPGGDSSRICLPAFSTSLLVKRVQLPEFPRGLRWGSRYYRIGPYQSNSTTTKRRTLFIGPKAACKKSANRMRLYRTNPKVGLVYTVSASAGPSTSR